MSYAAIPQIRTLVEPLKSQVQAAFAASLVVLWQVLLGIAGIGLLSSLMIKELPMQTITDERWGLSAGDSKVKQQGVVTETEEKGNGGSE